MNSLLAFYSLKQLDLDIRDGFYQLLREAPPIASGTEARTYRFKAESRTQALALLSTIKWCADPIWVAPDVTWAHDAEAQFTLNAGGPTLTELRWLFRQLPGPKMAADTLDTALSYTGRTATGCMESQRPAINVCELCASSVTEWARDMACDEEAVRALARAVSSQPANR